GRPRLLQRRPGPLLRRYGGRANCAKDPDVERRQARLLHPARLHLQRRARPLHLPGGAKLTKIHRRVDHTEDFDRYRHLSACFTCPLRPRCTPTKRRIIKRWENEDVLDGMQDRLDRMPEAMGVRRQTVEHPFGTLKAWMGATHFLTRTLDKVRTEMSLHVLAYNLKRMIAIFGAG